MELIRESCLYRLWLAFCALWNESLLGRGLDALWRRCVRAGRESVLVTVLCREGAVARGWKDSLLCRALTALINLPGWLLHRLYLALRPAFDSSFFAGLAFEAGRETAIAQAWLVMLLWMIPFVYWNNAYNLMAYVLLLLLFYVRGMREASARVDLAAVGFYPVVMFAAVCLAVPLSTYPGSFGRVLMYHAVCALCVLVTVSAVRDSGDLKRLCAGAGGAVLVASLYGVVQRIQGVEVNPSYVDLEVNAGMPGRVQSFFDNPNTFAEVLLLLLPLLAALVLCSGRRFGKLLAAGVFAVGVAALGMTYSRASWVGIACAAAVFVFLWRPKLIPAFAVLCVLCIPLLPSTIWHRILTITACCSIVITAVYILRVVGKILYGTCTNEHHLQLTDATWDERVAVVCLIVSVAGLGLAPLWVSNMIHTGVAPVVEHILPTAQVVAGL